MKKIIRIGMLAIIGVALASLALAVQYAAACKSSATDAAVNLRQCTLLAREIEGLRTSPRQAALEVQSQQELASLLQQAGKSAKVPEAAVISIHPEATRRIAKTAYVEQPTRIELRQVTMGQIVNFLIEVTSRDLRILPTSLRLSAPRAKGIAGAETWQTEVVLTHVVFSPESADH
jgi:hypothetical protein